MAKDNVLCFSKKMKFLFILLLCFLLSGCNSTDYDEAKTAAESKEYEEAIEKYVQLGDYKDSKEQAISLINTYESELESREKYSQAIDLLKKYSSLADYTDKISELEEQKKLKDTYDEAIGDFIDERINAGFEKLSSLPKDYKDVQHLYDSYDSIKDCKFKGSFMNGTKGSETSQSIKFSIGYDLGDFKLHVHKEVYYSDGSLYKDHDYYISEENINGNTISHLHRYEWTIGSGGLTEVEKGNTYYYR